MKHILSILFLLAISLTCLTAFAAETSDELVSQNQAITNRLMVISQNEQLLVNESQLLLQKQAAAAKELRQPNANAVSINARLKDALDRASAISMVQFRLQQEKAGLIGQKDVVREKLQKLLSEYKALAVQEELAVQVRASNSQRVIQSNTVLLLTDVQGMTDSSFERAGFSVKELLDIRTSDRGANEDRFTTLFNGELNTLPRIGEKNIAINRLQAEWRKPNQDIIFGDFTEYYSEYSFNQKLKGVLGKFTLSDDLSVSAILGLGNRTWEELVDESRSTSYRSQVIGAHAEGRLNREFDWQSEFFISSEYANSASLNTEAKDNMVYSGSFRWKNAYLKNLALQGEYAASSYSTATIGKAGDIALNLRGALTDGLAKTTFQFKRVGDRFFNIGLPVENDINEIRAEYQNSFYQNTLAAKISYRNYNDNLGGRKSATQTNSVPKLEVNYKPRQDLSLFFIKEITRRQNDDNSVNDNTDLNQIRARQQLGEVDLIFDYRLRDKTDNASSGNANIAQNIYALTLQGEKLLAQNLLLGANYKYENDIEQYSKAVNSTNQLGLNFTYGMTATEKIIVNTLWWTKHRTISEDMQKALYDLAWENQLGENNKVAARYKLNDYTFADASKNYRESILSVEGSMSL
ncbi:MAG: hypothetical protein WC838_01035 [Candidatus Margulisiibacteriota bacterium]